jgi:hypothetical protein
MLTLAEDLLKKGEFDKALASVRRIYDTDPHNMYARAYEERILTERAERHAREEVDKQLSIRMKEMDALLSIRKRDLLAAKEKSEEQHRNQESYRAKDDVVLKEIDSSIHTARERLYEVILSRTLDPERAATQAKTLVNTLSDQLRQRLEKIRSLMIDHEKSLLQTLEAEHHAKTRKLYRSLHYMMQKLGTPLEQRGSLLYLVSYFAQLEPDEEAELQHSANLGIYEDLLKRVFVQEVPNRDTVGLLEKTRTDFGISEAEHDTLLAHVKNNLLLTERVPTMAVIDASAELRESVAAAVRAEFPRVRVVLFDTPDDFLRTLTADVPQIVLSGTVFGHQGTAGVQLMKTLKTMPAIQAQGTDLILMLPTTDPLFKEAVEEIGIGRILQKPFSKELLMWTLRPSLFRASGAPVIGG